MTLALVVPTGCDERLSDRILAASKRQEERERQLEKAATKLETDALTPAIREVLEIVKRSDYKFVVVKGDRKRRYSGPEFQRMLESKTHWLGRDITDLDTWFSEIATSTFFKQRAYLVRLPSGQEVEFTGWVKRELEMQRRLSTDGRDPGSGANSGQAAPAEVQAEGPEKEHSR